MIKNVSARKLALLVLVVLLTAVVLDLLLWFISPGEAVVTQAGNVVYLDLTEVTPVNCVFDDTGHQIPANGDPHLVFSLSQDKEIYSVAVRLAQPLYRKSYVQLYYGVDEISERDSVGFSAKAGTKEFYFNLPGGRYATIRLDMNADCWLDAVSCSDQPAGFLRTPPFRPLRILLIAAVLGLCVFIFTQNKVKIFIRRLDLNWINPETRRPFVTIVYAVFAMAMLLHHVVVTLWYPDISKGTDMKLLWVLFPVFALISILLGHMWNDKGFWFLAALVALEYLRLAIPTPVVSVDFSSILYAFFGCSSVARALGTKACKPFLKVFCLLWCLFAGTLCAFGCFATLTNMDFFNLSSGAISVNYTNTHGITYRLSLFYFMGISGMIAASCFAVSMIGLTLSEFKIAKVFYFVICAVSLFATCFTNSRSAYLLISVSASLLLCLWLRKRFLFPLFPGKILLVSFVVVVMVVSFMALSCVPSLFGLVRKSGGLFLSDAIAEDASLLSTVPASQETDALSSFLTAVTSGRINLWRTILQYLCSNPSHFLWGNSIHDPMSAVQGLIVANGLGSENFYHTHNLFLQIFLESGIFGLLMLIAFYVSFAFCAARLMKNRSHPLWLCAVPVPVIAIILGELVESSTLLNYCFPPVTLLYLFLGFTAAFGAKKAPEKN